MVTVQSFLNTAGWVVVFFFVFVISLVRNKSTFYRFKQKHEEYILRLLVQVHVVEGEQSPDQAVNLQRA